MPVDRDYLVQQLEFLRGEVDKVRAGLETERDPAERQRTVEHLGRTVKMLAEVAAIVGEVLPTAPEPPKVFSEQMTPAAVEKRNKAISETKGEGDPLIAAIHKAGYASLNAYADHLKVSPGSLVAYRDGVRPIPRLLHDRIKREIRFSDWPKGTSD